LKTILFIGHDANRAGAQLVLLNLMRLLNAEGYQMRLLLGDGGPLLNEYRSICPVTLWPSPSPYVVNTVADKVLWKLGLWPSMREQQTAKHRQQIQSELGLDTVDLVFVNTVTSSRWFCQLDIPAKTPVVTFVHELAMSVRIYTQPDELAQLLARTNRLLAVSAFTARYYETVHGVDSAKITQFTLIDVPTLEQGVARAKASDAPLAVDLPADAQIVGGCGNAEWRKGTDLFVMMARQVIGAANPDGTFANHVHFVWVGIPPGTLCDDLLLDIDKAGLTGRVHLIAPTPDVLQYICRFNVFMLCSREDPYPLVVFEAGLCGVPVVAFAGAGGSPELIGTDGGIVVPYLDIDAMGRATLGLIDQPEKAQKMGQRLGEKIRQQHPAQQSIQTLVTLFNEL